MELSTDFRRALTTSSAETPYTAKVPTATEPAHSAANGLFDVSNGLIGGGDGAHAPKFIQIVPFGTAADDDQFSFQLWGWNKVAGASLWIPQLLVEATAVLSTVSGTAIAADTLMADTITITKGAADTSLNSVIVTSNNLGPASILCHLRGVQKIEFEFDMLTGGDSGNLYWRYVDDCF